jgi:uncharacterized protein (TIGR00251 family)
MTAPATRVRVRVTPRATRTELVGRHGGAWRIRVAAPPEKGRANEHALDALAAAVGLPRASVRIVAGASARDKVVEVTGLGGEEVERRLTAAGGRRDGEQK